MTGADRLLGKLLRIVWRAVSSHPLLLIAAAALLAAAGALAAHRFLDLNSDQDRLVSPDLPYMKKNLELLENFGDQEYLFVVIRAGGTVEGMARAEAFADRLAARLRTHPELVRAVYYRITASDLGAGALLYAPPAEIGALAGTLRWLSDPLRHWFHDGSLAGFLSEAAALLMPHTEGEMPDPAILRPGLVKLENLLTAMRANLSGEKVSPPSFEPAGLGERYFFAGGGELLVMRILPDKDYGTLDVIGAPLAAVREALAATRVEFPEVAAGLTGRPVLQADEMQTTNRDMTRASVIAIVLVGLLFILVLHGWLRPLMIMAALLVAMAWTFGFATIAVGELNLLSIVFALVLVGIGVDFGVHLVTRVLEGERHGIPLPEAVREALFATGPGIILGALTSVCAFYSVLGSDFHGLAELGLIGGTGILLSLLAMCTVLPALILLTGRRLLPRSAPLLVVIPFGERLSNRPALLLVALAAVTAALLPGAFREHFDYNLLELQARGLESVEYERLLIEKSEESTWYAVFTADTLEEVQRLAARIRELPTVGKVETILEFLPRDQEQKREMLAGVAAALQDLPARPADPDPPEAPRLQAALQSVATAIGRLGQFFAAGAAEEMMTVDSAIGAAEQSRHLLTADPERAARLAGMQDALRREIADLTAQLRSWLAPGSITPADLPGALRELYIGRDGRFQIKVTPKGDVWDFGNLGRFVAELRSIDPQAGGVPVGVLESARLMHRTFLSAAALTLLLVSLLLWIYSRSVRYVLLTLLPLAVGVLWLVELMGWFGWSFNLANFFAIPILIAIGVDGGVHLLARWQELQGRGGLFSTSTPTAVALSFATTMIGFSGLLLAQHRGLASLGAVMVLGSLTSMLACLLVLPAVLKLTRTAR